jgi:Mlc titration factor MtfA (ptsG expression regulator)
MFAWFKRQRRRKLTAAPFPAAWKRWLEANVAMVARLSAEERRRLQDDLRVLVAEKHWEGCGGLSLTDEMRVTIAGQAAVLLLNMRHDYFPHVLSILVYPSFFKVRQQWRDEDGLVHDGWEERDGEAWERGPVILGWREVLADGRHYGDGRNVVLHEFAHQLDFLDGRGDGTPPLPDPAAYRRWREVMSREFAELVRLVEADRETLIDPYGAESPEEFFAVLTETFFEQPVALAERHPEVYALLAGYYGQNPSAWTAH